MIRSALVPLDGSLASRSAQAFAIELANRYNLFLEGLCVLDVPTITAGAATPVGGSAHRAPRDKALIEDARKKVAGFIEAFDAACSEAGVDHDALAVEGTPYKAINRHARRSDVIFLGRQTFFHFETQDDPGETLKELIADCARPLIVVPEHRTSGTGTVVATDDGAPSAHAVQLFAQLGLFAEEPVHVVAVNKNEHIASAIAETSSAYLMRQGYRAVPNPIVSTKPAAEILLAHVESIGAGMIVMGTHATPGIVRRLFVGSTALEIIRDTPIPVFVHH